MGEGELRETCALENLEIHESLATLDVCYIMAPSSAARGSVKVY